MTTAGERRRRHRVFMVGERHQRFEVSAPGTGGHDRELVHHLFARELHARDEPPDAGMEPENGSNGFLNDQPHPVTTPNVKQLMRKDGPLHVRRFCPQPFGQQNQRSPDAEGHRLSES
jgi:hypothetical protein